MKRPILAANWKMNHGPTAAREFMRSFLSHYPRQYDRTVLFFPPAVALSVVAQETSERPDIMVGVQNIHWADQGAYTGELSGAMARDAGAKLALVGHSERRHVFGETDDQCADKCAAAERAGLVPLLCVGETLQQRERDETTVVVTRQLRMGLSKLSQLEATGAMIAYEPVWAIGTGRNATPEDASATHAVLRTELRQLLGNRASAVHILYGGSVNSGNAALLLAAQDVDGLLVGGSSLEPGSWLSVVRSVPPSDAVSLDAIDS